MCHGRAKEELQTGAGRAAHAVPQPHEQPPLETKPLRPATIPGTTPPMISELKRAAASLDYDELHIGAGGAAHGARGSVRASLRGQALMRLSLWFLLVSALIAGMVPLKMLEP